MKLKKKNKKVKPRIKVAPPSKRHKTVKDYDRKALKKEDSKINHEDASFIIPPPKLSLDQCGCTPEKGCLDKEEPEEIKKSEKYWFDYFFEIFGFKRT